MVQLSDYEKEQFEVEDNAVKQVFPGSDKRCLLHDYHVLRGAMWSFEETHMILNYLTPFGMMDPSPEDKIMSALQQLEDALREYMEDEVYKDIRPIMKEMKGKK